MTTTTSNVRLTKRDFFNAALSSLDMNAVFTIPKGDGFVEISGADMAGFYNHEIELLDRKNTVDKKPTKTQQENEVIKSAVLSAMEANRLYSISEMLKEFPACKDMSNQKLSSLVRQMVLDKQVERIEDKRKAFFRKVSE